MITLKQLRFLSLTALVLACLVACGGSEDLPTTPNTSSSSTSSSSSSSSSGAALSCAQAKDAGKVLFESSAQGCATCHGADAQSATFKKIDLDASLYRHSSMSAASAGLPLEEYIAAYMPSPGTCTGECATNIAVYLKSLSNTPWCPGDAPEPVAEQREVYPRVLHRLSNLQYQNALRDLLGITVDVSNTFPPDAAVGGFSNAAEGLSMSSARFDLYFKTAYSAIEASVAFKPDYLNRTLGNHFDISGSKGALVGEDAWRLNNTTATLNLTVPKAGQYDLSFAFSAIAIAHENPDVRVALNGQQLFEQTITAGAIKPQIITRTMQLEAGALAINISNPNWFNMPAGNQTTDLVVHSIQVESKASSAGPIVAKGNNCDITQRSCAETIMTTVARQAFGRQMTSAEHTNIMALFNQTAATEGNVNGLKMALRVILNSPQFLFHYVSGADVEGDRLSGYVIAKRLAAFLWSSIPDDDLITAAENGELDSNQGIETQVTRMLADSKSGGLVNSFAREWLKVNLLQTHAPNTDLFPQYTNALKNMMSNESTLFFKDYLTNNLSIRSMVNPDFAYLNNTLADLYGEPRPNSNTLTRVARSGNDRRGLLELSAWLVAESNPSESSPIKRGQWILDHISCEPANPPPPDAATVLPNEPNLTLEERLALHRTDKTCAACHDKIDPAGLGFEHFDAIGAPQVSNVVAIGKLPDGTTFRDSRELAEKLLHTETFANCFTKKFYTFAMGRRVQKGEADFIQDVFEASQRGETTLINLAKIIATSKPFTHVPSEGISIEPSRTLEDYQWTNCAAENGTCAVDGYQLVRYGAQDSWVAKLTESALPCDNATFGDPIKNTIKTCEKATPIWQACADEGAECNFSGRALIRYGANGSWTEAVHTNGVACSNAVFGDPIPGTAKSCALAELPAEVSP